MANSGKELQISELKPELQVMTFYFIYTEQFSSFE
jgi:hypothetical protein